MRVAVELRLQRPVAVAGVLGPLQEVVAIDALLEFVGAQEVVVDTVLLTRSRVARRRRNRQRHPREARQKQADQRPLAHPGRTGDYEDVGYRLRNVTSSPRWRSERPPTVLLGEIRHCVRIRLTFTRPYFGTASSRSNTFAVSRYSGGSSRSPCMWTRPAFKSRLRFARLVRMSLARLSASILWVSDRSGAGPRSLAISGFGGV